MKKMNVCAILALLLTVTFSTAHASSQRLESYVGKRILPHEVLKVKQELGLRQYQGIGKDLKSVAVVLTTRRRGATATLMINQRPVSTPQYIAPGQRGVARFVLPQGRRINQQMRTVQVKFDGPVVVELVRGQIVDARRTPAPRPTNQTIGRDVYRFQAGFAEKVSLTSLMDLRPRQQERRIKSIRVKVRSLVGRSTIQLCRANGNCIAQKVISDNDGEKVIVLNPQASPKLGRLSLQTSGMVFISKVTAVLE